MRWYEIAYGIAWPVHVDRKWEHCRRGGPEHLPLLIASTEGNVGEHKCAEGLPARRIGSRCPSFGLAGVLLCRCEAVATRDATDVCALASELAAKSGNTQDDFTLDNTSVLGGKYRGAGGSECVYDSNGNLMSDPNQAFSFGTELETPPSRASCDSRTRGIS